MNVFIPSPLPHFLVFFFFLFGSLGVLSHFIVAYICQTANPEKLNPVTPPLGRGASLQSRPRCAFIPFLVNSLACSGVLEWLLALTFLSFLVSKTWPAAAPACTGSLQAEAASLHLCFPSTSHTPASGRLSVKHLVDECD